MMSPSLNFRNISQAGHTYVSLLLAGDCIWKYSLYFLHVFFLKCPLNWLWQIKDRTWVECAVVQLFCGDKYYPDIGTDCITTYSVSKNTMTLTHPYIYVCVSCNPLVTQILNKHIWYLKQLFTMCGTNSGLASYSYKPTTLENTPFLPRRTVRTQAPASPSHKNFRSIFGPLFLSFTLRPATKTFYSFWMQSVSTVVPVCSKNGNHQCFKRMTRTTFCFS